MTTFANAILDLARLLMPDTIQSAATGGNATTVVDNTRTEPDEHFNQGTIWMLSGNNAGKTGVITSWDLPTTTFTFPTMTLLNANGNSYAASPGTFPRDKLREFVNQARRTIGPVISENVALVTVADQEDYTLPAGVYNVLRVEVATELSAPYKFEPSLNWEELGGEIRFDTDFAPDEDGYMIRLLYRPVQVVDLTADADVVSDYLHTDLLKWEAAVNAWRWLLRARGGDDPTAAVFLNEALVNARRERGNWLEQVDALQKDVHLSRW